MCSISVPCPLCAQTNFPNIDSLRISLIKAANGPLTCPICRDTLLGLDKLTIHLFSHTNLIGDSSSSTVNSTTSVGVKTEKSALEEGYLNCVTTYTRGSDTSPPKSVAVSDLFVNQPKCETCGLTFRTGDLLNMHNKLIHQIPGPTPTASNDARYQCHLCAKVFKMKGSLRVHLKVVHFLGLPAVQTIPKLSICDQTKQKTVTSPRQVIVASPAVAATNIQVMMVPQNLPNNLRTEGTPPNLDEDDVALTQDLKLQNESGKGSESTKIWECDICSKSFTTKYFLKKHKRLHTGEMPYTCEICGKTFTFQQSYHKHLLYHSDEKPHVCQTCGRAFKELSTLHNHERIHSGEKPFKCETCGKCFRQRVSYLVHKRIHTGVMPYKCNACQKSFRYKVSQRTHKCTAQPPEVPSSEDILQKLLHSTSILQEENCDISENVNRLASSPECASTGSKEKLNEELLAKSIDEIVAESCNKMGIGSNDGVPTSYCINNNNEERMPSPSEGFQNLCLYSPSNEPVVAHLEVINEDSFKQFLYEVNEHL